MTLGVFIGRFQPFHLGHWHLIKQGLAKCDRVLILVGSATSERTVKNPFTYPERCDLIQKAIAELSSQDASRVVIAPLEDCPDDDQRWIEQVHATVQKNLLPSPLAGEGPGVRGDIALILHDKDDSTYYLKYFSDWQKIDVDNYQGLNATQVREVFFKVHSADQIDLIEGLPKATKVFLKAFYMTRDYQILCDKSYTG